MARFQGSAKGGRFIGYDMDFPVRPGTLLFDTTSDIDGVTQLVSWRSPVASPQVNYDNLTVTHLTPPLDVIGPKDRVGELVKSLKRAKAYAAWIEATVLRNTEPGEKVLVVVHKAMLTKLHLLPDSQTLGSDAYDLQGRKVAFINWGYGIGSKSMEGRDRRLPVR